MNFVENIEIPSGKSGDKVAILVFFQGKLLLCLEPQKHKIIENCLLKFPGGKIEQGKGIIKTAQSELFEELGIEEEDSKKFNYLKSLKYKLDGKDKTLHFVSYHLTEPSLINIDNLGSEKKEILSEEGKLVKVPEIFRPVFLSPTELACHKNFNFVSEQVKSSIGYLLELMHQNKTK